MACWHVGPLDPRVDLDRGVARVPPRLERRAFSVQGVRLEDENSLSSSLAWPGLGGSAGVSLLSPSPSPSPPGPSLHTHAWLGVVCVCTMYIHKARHTGCSRCHLLYTWCPRLSCPSLVLRNKPKGLSRIQGWRAASHASSESDIPMAWVACFLLKRSPCPPSVPP